MLSELKEILKRIEKYPKSLQQKMLQRLKDNVEDMDIILEEKKKICDQEGHVYDTENEGWIDESYSIGKDGKKIHISALSIRSNPYLLNNNPISKEGIQICFTRKCTRCGEVETKNKIPLVLFKGKK